MLLFKIITHPYYNYSLLREFKEANIISMFAIEKAARKELMNVTDGNDTDVRNRKKKVDRDGLLKMSSGAFYTI